MRRFLLESASMKKPIITTDVPGCRDIVIDSYNGYLFLFWSQRFLYCSRI